MRYYGEHREDKDLVNVEATKDIAAQKIVELTHSIPAGGKTKQALVKSNDGDFNAEWKDLENIHVGDEEPTSSDIKIWIDTDESGNQIDSEVKKGSNNAVSGNGVYNALDGKADYNHGHNNYAKSTLNDGIADQAKKVTHKLTFNDTEETLPGSSFDGSADLKISYKSIGAEKLGTTDIHINDNNAHKALFDKKIDQWSNEFPPITEDVNGYYFKYESGEYRKVNWNSFTNVLDTRYSGIRYLNILGEAIANDDFNQLVPTSFFPNSTESITIVKYDNYFTISGTTGTDNLIIQSKKINGLINGHTYYIQCICDKEVTFKSSDNKLETKNQKISLVESFLPDVKFEIVLKANTEYTADKVYIQLIDLTRIFGKDNEPDLNTYNSLFKNKFYRFRNDLEYNCFWENQNPNENYPKENQEQEVIVIPVENNYKQIQLIYKHSVTDNKVNQIILPLNCSTYVEGKDELFRPLKRIATINNNKITFDNGVMFDYQFNKSYIDNSVVIPLKLYGVR